MLPTKVKMLNSYLIFFLFLSLSLIIFFVLLGGITGGGVDGAITMAGGEKLFEARKALPILPGKYIH